MRYIYSINIEFNEAPNSFESIYNTSAVLLKVNDLHTLRGTKRCESDFERLFSIL